MLNSVCPLTIFIWLKNKKRLYSIILSVMILMAFISCSRSKVKEWTVLVYMAADNNLSFYAIEDIVSMQKARLNDNIQVIVQVDFNRQYYQGQTVRLKVQPNSSNVLASPFIEVLPDIDSGCYLSLAEFVNWGIKNYPGRRYSLFIWSHGSGWTREETPRAVCPDSQSYNEISIAKGELRKAFSMFASEMDIVVFDACNMQNVEVAAEIKDYAQYMVGSSDVVIIDGFPYKEIFSKWRPFFETETTAKMIADSYFNYYIEYDMENFRINSSVINLNDYEVFMYGLQNWLQSWVHLAASDKVREARKACYGFNFPDINVDIKQFYEELLKVLDDSESISSTLELIDLIDEIFILQRSSNYSGQAGTATIWFPDEVYQLTGSYELYNKLIFSQTGWLDFLQLYVSE